MAKFIRLSKTSQIINIDDVRLLSERNGMWRAVLREGIGDGITVEVGDSNTVYDAIELATATIVPAAPDETLHRFWFIDTEHSLGHDRTRIIAWAINGYSTTPITPEGPATLGYNGEFLYVIQHPDGRYDDLFDRIFTNEADVRATLEQAATTQPALSETERCNLK